jgi:prefoldin subunit 5
MVVMTPRETWTDERLDEFKASVNQRFDEVDKRFDQVDKRLDGIDADIRELRGEIGQIRESMEAMQRTMVHGAIGMCGVMITGFVALASLAAF